LRERVDGITNVLTVDVEEYYHGVEFGEALTAEARASLPSRVVAETERLLALLERHDARATFFTLGIVAERYPRLVRAIAERGHEVASHGWDHTHVRALGRERFAIDVRRAKRALESASGRAVRGYRAPNYSIGADTPWVFEVLAEEGYAYDSSVHPIVHDRYGLPDAPRFPHVVRRFPTLDFWEVPVGTARFASTNLPLGGGFFRLFPGPLLTAAIESVNRRERRPVVLYVHPWEFDPGQPRPPMKALQRFRHYVGLRRAEAKLDALLSRFRFTTVVAAFAGLAPLRRPAAALAS